MSPLGPRFAVLALAVLGFVAAAPSGAMASVTLGANDLSPTGSGAGCQGPCTFWLEALPGGEAQAPFDGVVVRWRVQLEHLQASGGNGRLRVLSRSGGQVTALRSGRSFPLAVGLNEFADRVPIAAGETVGFDIPGTNDPIVYTEVEIREAPGAAFERASPPLADGTTRAEGSPLALADYEPLFNAVVEPDADHDGFGDESQDVCPSAAGPSLGCPKPLGPAPQSPSLPASPPAPDLTPPHFLGDAGVHPRRLLPGGGATFAFALSEPALVTISFKRARPGRRVGRRCRKPTRRNAHRRRCRRFVATGSLSAKAPAGNSRIPWAGRLHGHPLRPGTYRAVLTATDAAGNAARPARTSFTVRPLPRHRG